MDRYRGQGAERDEPDTIGGCAAFGPLLEAYYHHALEPHAARSVAEHAAGCSLCSAALERFAATDQLIADAPMPTPGPELHRRLAARIATARAHRPERSPGLVSPMPIERTAVVQDVNDRDTNNQRRTGPRIPTHARKGVQRTHALLGTVAAALVVALLAGMLLTRMHAPLGQTTNGGYGNFSPAQGVCAPGKITAQVPKDGDIGSLDMVSPDEGWAIGGVMDPTTLELGKSFILHFRNCAWTPIVTSIPDAGLSSISMGSASDGWAVGGTTSGAPFAMHYMNGVWKPVTPPGADVFHGLFSYRAVHMLSADEGWIGVNLEKDSQGNLTSALLHFANGKWSQVDTPFAVMSTVLPVAPADAWVVGYATKTAQAPDMYHYQAGKWTRMAAPPGITIFTLRMVSPNNIWASGLVSSESGTRTIEAAVAHYDGSKWQQVAVGASGSPEDAEAFDQSTSWAFTKYDPSVTTGTAPPPNNPPTITEAQYQHDGSWQHVAWPFTNLSLIDSLTRVSLDEYWAIGYYYVTHQTPTGNGGYTGSGYAVGVLLYFANGAWHEIPTH